MMSKLGIFRKPWEIAVLTDKQEGIPASAVSMDLLIIIFQDMKIAPNQVWRRMR